MKLDLASATSSIVRPERRQLGGVYHAPQPSPVAEEFAAARERRRAGARVDLAWAVGKQPRLTDPTPLWKRALQKRLRRQRWRVDP